MQVHKILCEKQSQEIPHQFILLGDMATKVHLLVALVALLVACHLLLNQLCASIRSLLLWALLPLGTPGQECWSPSEVALGRNYTMHTLSNAESKDLTTADGRRIDSVWATPRGYRRENRRAVILLHGNQMNLDGLVESAEIYLGWGVCTLLVTFGGYPTPDPHAPVYFPDELTMYLDAEAALEFLVTVEHIPATNVLVHGLSAGGGAAHALGVRHPVLVTADKTYTSLEEVAAAAVTMAGKGWYFAAEWTVTRLMLRAVAPAVQALVPWVARRLVFPRRSTAWPCSQPDGLLNEAKARAKATDPSVRAPYFVFYASEDEIMSPDFAPRLITAGYWLNSPRDAVEHPRLFRCGPSHSSSWHNRIATRAAYSNELWRAGFLRHRPATEMMRHRRHSGPLALRVNN